MLPAGPETLSSFFVNEESASGARRTSSKLGKGSPTVCPGTEAHVPGRLLLMSNGFNMSLADCRGARASCVAPVKPPVKRPCLVGSAMTHARSLQGWLNESLTCWALDVDAIVTFSSPVNCGLSWEFPLRPDYTLHAHREVLFPSHAHPGSL